MARVQPNHVPQTFLAALGVDTDSIQVGRRYTLQQAKIPGPQNRKVPHRLCGVCPVIPQSLGPAILIVANQLRTIMGQHHAEPIPPHELRVRQMLHHVTNGPFAGGLGLGELLL